MADVVGIYTKQTGVTEFLTADGSSPLMIHRCLRSTCGDDDDDDDGGGDDDDDYAIDVSKDNASTILKAVKRTLVTGPAAANKPQQQWTPKTRLMH